MSEAEKTAELEMRIHWAATELFEDYGYLLDDVIAIVRNAEQEAT